MNWRSPVKNDEVVRELKDIYKELTMDDWDNHSHRRDYEYSWALSMLDPSARRILDAGCGSSPLLLYLKRHGKVDLTGIDVQSTFDNPTFSFNPEWASKYDINYVQANMINYRSRVFDAVFSISVIEHIFRPIDRLKALVNLWENLRYQGRMIITLDDTAELLEGFALSIAGACQVVDAIKIEDKVYGLCLYKDNFQTRELVGNDGDTEYLQQNAGL